MLENVGTDKVAYFIGFLAGDGNYQGPGNTNRKPRLGVTTTDEEVVDWINKHITDFDKSNAKIGGSNEQLGIYGRMLAYKKTFPVSFSDEFHKYGILCKKPHRVIKNINHGNMRHWLRGFLDADGHVSYSHRKDRNRISGKVGFTHPSTDILETIKDYLTSELNIKCSITKKGSEDCYVLSFSKLGDMNKFRNHIYKSEDEVVLTRKYQTFLDMKKELLDGVESGRMFPKDFIQSTEYRKIVGGVNNKVYIDANGVEYFSIYDLLDKNKIPKERATNRCRNGIKGFSMREKTEHELKVYEDMLQEKTQSLFNEWLTNNPEYYV